MARVSFEFKKGDLVWVSLVVVLLCVGFVVATWDSSKVMFHSSDDVKITIGGVDYSLQNASDLGLVGGGDMSCHIVSKNCPSAGLCDVTCDYGERTGGGMSGADTDLTYSRFEDYLIENGWRINIKLRTFNIDAYAVCCENSAAGSGSPEIQNIMASAAGVSTVTAECTEGRHVKYALGFTNDYNSDCYAKTRQTKCSFPSFVDCIGQSSCTYTGVANGCGLPGDTCLQVICG